MASLLAATGALRAVSTPRPFSTPGLPTGCMSTSRHALLPGLALLTFLGAACARPELPT